ncbi:MAG: nitrate reductase molybdenum cofactor assembly chaperone, partial [Nocardia sp.]|nr:nitrate reductase molybdenum cofactor assembly chaperone [Nocardia sp.]
MGLLNLRRRPAAVVEMSERDRRLIWRIAALVLDYPKPDTLGMLDELTAAARTVPEPAREHLTELLAHLSGTDPLESARAYVETFDLRRRASLHLTYYAYGDTRKRGMALLRFKHAYRHAQVELSDRELPDHL